MKNVVELHKQENQEIPPQDPYSNVDALKAFMKAKGLTGAEIARRLDCSTSKISQYLHRKYLKSAVAAFNLSVGQMLAAEKLYETFTPQIQGRVLTKQIREVLFAIDFVQYRSIALFLGEAGIGKTEGLKEYARQNPDTALLVTLTPFQETKNAFIKHLYARIPGNKHKRIACSEKLDEIILYFRKKRKMLLLDEAHFLNLKAQESARTIQDLTGIGIVFSGTFALSENLMESAQLYSRIRVRRVIDPEIQKDDLRQVLALYGIQDAKILDWLFKGCNRIGRRYRWVASMVESAHILCQKRSLPFAVDRFKEVEELIGLDQDIPLFI